MNQEITLIIATAITIGFLHTVLGPDHYLPFIALSKARKWTLKRTLLITALCGIGHIAGSVIIGFIGIEIGSAVESLELFESFRGSLAAWMLIGFGLFYSVWGIRFAVKNKIKLKPSDEVISESSENKKAVPWIIFIIFAFGPCEPLIPILMYPAAQHSLSGTLLVASVFGITTIITMLACVTILVSGLKLFKLKKAERFSHLIAGSVILFSGLAIQFLGL